jgi:rsbT co-antagonist protein RsbR
MSPDTPAPDGPVATASELETLRRRVASLEAQVLDQATEIEKQRSEALRYRRYFDFAQIGMTTTSLEAGWLEFNQRLCDMLGYTPEELRRTNWVELTHPDDLSIDMEQFRKVTTGEIQRYSVDKRFIRKDGSILYGNILIQGVYRPDGSFDHIFGFLHDITERRNAEAERLALQQKIIDAQSSSLRELSTPLIPVADKIIVMPLVGKIDTIRAQAVLEAVLEGVASYRAQITILDVTGVQAMDSQVANALIHAAQAVKLLGAQTVITGIQPRIAQTLVGLNVDLSAVVTLSTLQEGIAHALRRLKL